MSKVTKNTENHKHDRQEAHMKLMTTPQIEFCSGGQPKIPLPTPCFKNQKAWRDGRVSGIRIDIHRDVSMDGFIQFITIPIHHT